MIKKPHPLQKTLLKAANKKNAMKSSKQEKMSAHKNNRIKEQRSIETILHTRGGAYCKSKDSFQGSTRIMEVKMEQIGNAINLIIFF